MLDENSTVECKMLRAPRLPTTTSPMPCSQAAPARVAGEHYGESADPSIYKCLDSATVKRRHREAGVNVQ